MRGHNLLLWFTKRRARASTLSLRLVAAQYWGLQARPKGKKRKKKKKKSWLKDEFLVMGNMSRERRLDRHADVGCRIPAMPSWKSDWVSWFQHPGAPGEGEEGESGGS